MKFLWGLNESLYVICLKRCGPDTSYVLYEWINHGANQQLADRAALRNLFFFKIFFFFMWTMSSKPLLNLLQHYLCSTFCLLGQEACGIEAPQPGVEPLSPCIGRQSLNHWITTEVPEPGFKGDTIIQQRAWNGAWCVISRVLIATQK